MRFLLDANIMRHYSERHPTLYLNLAKVAQPDLALSILTVIEMRRGRYDGVVKATPENFLQQQERLLATEQTIERFELAWFDAAAVREFQQLRAQISTKKRRPDALLAAQARAHRLIVVTRNTKDFADLLPALQLQNWIDHIY